MSEVPVVVSEKRKNIHARALVYLLEIDPLNLEEIRKTHNVLGVFGTTDEANTFMDQYMFQMCKEYTKYLNDNGMHVPDSVVNARYVIAYITSDVAVNPGYFTISLIDFLTLQQLYPSISLASNEELEKLDVSILDDEIRVSRAVEERLKSVKFYETVFFDENATAADIKNTQDAMDQFQLFITNLNNISNISDSYARLAYIKSTQPGINDEQAQEIDKFYNTLITEVNKLKATGATDNDIIDYISRVLNPN